MNLKKICAICFLSAIFAILALPVFAFEPIVSCKFNSVNEICDFCQFFQMINRIIKFLLYYVIPPLVVVAILWAGGYFLFSGTNPNNITKGRQIFTVTISGVLIAFIAWVIVNTLIDQLVNKDAGIVWMPWYEIPKCATEEGGAPFPELPPPATTTPPIPGKKPPPEAGIPKCEADGQSVEISNIINCMSNKGIPISSASQIYAGEHKCSPEPPAVPTKVSCHYGGPITTEGCNGTSHAVDFGKNQLSSAGKTLKQAHDILEGTCNEDIGGVYYEDSNGKRYSSPENSVNHIHVNDIRASECGCN